MRLGSSMSIRDQLPTTSELVADNSIMALQVTLVVTNGALGSVALLGKLSKDLPELLKNNSVPRLVMKPSWISTGKTSGTIQLLTLSPRRLNSANPLVSLVGRNRFPFTSCRTSKKVGRAPYQTISPEL